MGEKCYYVVVRGQSKIGVGAYMDNVLHDKHPFEYLRELQGRGEAFGCGLEFNITLVWWKEISLVEYGMWQKLLGEDADTDGGS